MSQRRDTLRIIDRESGLMGRLVRPLSARLLPATVPEERGIIRREGLLAMSGRSRKPQMALAREFGLTDYPTPAGGCLLTDPIYSRRLQDLLRAVPDPSPEDLGLLRIGRHFRLSEGCKIIVGRNEQENERIARAKKPADVLMQVMEAVSPLVLLRGTEAGKFLGPGASLCARYSDAKHLPEVTVSVTEASGENMMRVRPAGADLIEEYMIR
jgi:tRNA-specific 2-thiouridylase